MNLTDKAIVEFQKLYLKIYNVEISYEEAMQYGQDLINILTTLIN